MAIEHVNITDGNGTTTSERHEPKGASIATAGQVYVSDGSASGDWTHINHYGGLYIVDTDTASIVNIGTTAAKITAFAHDAPSFGLTVSNSTDTITVAIAGDYYIDFHMSFSTAAAGDAGTYEIHVRKNDVETVIGGHRYLSGTTDTGSMSAGGILTLAASDVLTLYVESDEAGGTDDINILDMSFNVRLLKAS